MMTLANNSSCHLFLSFILLMLRSKSNRLAYRFYQNAQRRIEAAKQAAAVAAAAGEAAGLPTDQQKAGTAAKETSQEEITIVVDRDRKDKERPAVFCTHVKNSTRSENRLQCPKTAGVEMF
jgi:hypothetical protein